MKFSYVGGPADGRVRERPDNTTEACIVYPSHDSDQWHHYSRLAGDHCVLTWQGPCEAQGGSCMEVGVVVVETRAEG